MSIKQAQKVSIIMPYYNTGEFIEETLRSVVGQTYTNFELIIINDGSNYEDTAILESLLADDRMLYLKNEKNKGVAFSRNRGIKTANGDFILFLDSDDVLSNHALELLVRNIGEHQAILGSTKELVRPSDLENKGILWGQEQLNLIKSIRAFQTPSILNVLITREFAESHLFFPESTPEFSDISAVLALIESTQTLPKLDDITYYKRERNDPISNPSLNQRPLTERIREILTTFSNQKDQFNSEVTHSYLDNYLLNFYRRYALKLAEESQFFSEWIAPLSTALGMVKKDKILSQPIHIRRELRHLINRRESRFKRAIVLRGEILDLKRAFKGRTSLKRYVYKKIFLKMPLKEKYIVFESFLGKNYSDSPRNIYEYIIKNNFDYQCIWVFNDKNKQIPGNAKIVKRFSLAYYYYFAVSKYWVNNMRQPLHLVKREGNVFLETWHGTPLKKLVFDMKDVYSANPRYKRDFYLQSRAWDFLLSPNDYSSNIFRSAFKFNKEMLEFGYPRNDLLYSPDREDRARQIKKSLNIPEGKKVVLYAPTWRDDDFYQPGKYKFNLKLDLKKMKERLGSQYVVALRMHYFIADDLNVEGLEGFAFNLSKYDDISELYLISDILITDYSSVFFDYANLKRPILFFTYDLDKYRDQLRGFYLDFENEAPGPLLRKSDDVIEAIDNIYQVSKDYSPRYKEFYDKFCSWHDGKSTEKVVKRVFLGE